VKMTFIFLCLVFASISVMVSCRSILPSEPYQQVEWRSTRRDGKVFTGVADLREEKSPFPWMIPFKGGHSGQVVYQLVDLARRTRTTELLVRGGLEDECIELRQDGTIAIYGYYQRTNGVSVEVYWSFGMEGDSDFTKTIRTPGRHSTLQDVEFREWDTNGVLRSLIYAVVTNKSAPPKRVQDSQWWDHKGNLIAGGIYSNGLPWQGTFKEELSGSSISIMKFRHGKQVSREAEVRVETNSNPSARFIYTGQVRQIQGDPRRARALAETVERSVSDW